MNKFENVSEMFNFLNDNGDVTNVNKVISSMLLDQSNALKLYNNVLIYIEKYSVMYENHESGFQYKARITGPDLTSTTARQALVATMLGQNSGYVAVLNVLRLDKKKARMQYVNHSAKAKWFHKFFADQNISCFLRIDNNLYWRKNGIVYTMVPEDTKIRILWENNGFKAEDSQPSERPNRGVQEYSKFLSAQYDPLKPGGRGWATPELILR